MSEVGTADIENDRWVDLHKILLETGPFAQETFEAGPDVCMAFVHFAFHVKTHVLSL
jgi:hypothetical protein